MSYTDLHLYFDDVNVGQQWDSLGRTVTQADLVLFAGLSGDFNPFHMDHTFASNTVYRQPIAHGLLVWAICSGLGVYAPPMRTLAFLSIKDWIFHAPVFIGDTVRMRSIIVGKEERARGRRGVISWNRKVLNQDEKIVQEGFTETLVEGRGKKE